MTVLDSYAPVSILDQTNERMIPESSDAKMFWEHIYRYRFAAQFAKGKRVLDIACGEGYGTQALRRAGASYVLGIDIAEDVCQHVRCRYQLDALQSNAIRLPLADRSIDLIVSFETIEHLTAPAVFLDECRRVLAGNGRLIVSTPNREIYRRVYGSVYRDHGEQNPYHFVEFAEDEFLNVMRPRFKKVKLFTQRPQTAPWWSIRCLAADQSAWHHLRGFWRLRKLLMGKTSSWMDRALDEQIRATAVETIHLADNNDASKLVNPYEVRERHSLLAEAPIYLIAIGQV